MLLVFAHFAEMKKPYRACAEEEKKLEEDSRDLNSWIACNRTERSEAVFIRLQWNVLFFLHKLQNQLYLTK